MESFREMNIALNMYSIAICLILLAYLWMNNSKAERTNRFFIAMCLFNILMTLGDTTNWVFEGFAKDWYPMALRAGQVIYYACSAPLLLSFAGYLFEFYPVQANVRKMIWRGTVVLCGVQLLFSVLSYWNGMYFTTCDDNLYLRGDWFWLSQLIPGLIFLMDAALIVACRKHIRTRDVFFFSSYIFFVTIAQTIQFFNYGIALTNTGVTVSLLIVFINIQSCRELRMEKQEHELSNARIDVMLSQIHPHFLYNSLTAIRYLCKTDPDLAAETVVEFSEFLRGNMDSLSMREPIPFDKELHHVENYLAIEKKRFGERLNIVYAIDFRDFKLPALTLQPIVENAVRYGVTKKDSGGTIIISAQKFDNNAVISVIDDGTGFDPADLPHMPADGGRKRVGIANVSKRLADTCGGTLAFSHVDGKGTTVVITVPIS